MCDMIVLSQILKMMGEENLTTTWKQEFAEDPPLKEILETTKRLYNKSDSISMKCFSETLIHKLVHCFLVFLEVAILRHSDQLLIM